MAAIVKVWSDEAREAALEARRANAAARGVSPAEQRPDPEDRYSRSVTDLTKKHGFEPKRRIDGPGMRNWTNVYENPKTGEQIRHTQGQGLGGRTYDTWEHMKPDPDHPGQRGYYVYAGKGDGAGSLASHLSNPTNSRWKLPRVQAAKEKNMGPRIAKAAPKSGRPPGPRVIEIANTNHTVVVRDDADVLRPAGGVKDVGTELVSPAGPGRVEETALQRVGKARAKSYHVKGGEDPEQTVATIDPGRGPRFSRGKGKEKGIVKVWSDEAREAALEARRRNAAGRDRDLDDEGLSERVITPPMTVQDTPEERGVIGEGFKRGFKNDPEKPSVMSHPDGHKLEIGSKGKWRVRLADGDIRGGESASGLKMFLREQFGKPMYDRQGRPLYRPRQGPTHVPLAPEPKPKT